MKGEDSLSQWVRIELLVLQRDLSGLKLPLTLTIDLKRPLSMGSVGRIVAHLMILDDVKGSLEIENLLP